MICFDTNILIYLGKGLLGNEVATTKPVYISDISKIEALGYWDIRSAEEAKITDLLDTLVQVPIDKRVINQAIALRQAKKMSLGDSIVAATALENDLELWTANIADFEHIEGLSLKDPTRGKV